MSVTIKTLADKLDLSTATVSRVLNARESAFVSDKTRQRVMAVAKELGYRPNQMARALVTGRTNTIGLLAFAIYPCHYSQILHYMQKMLKDYNYNLQIMETLNVVHSKSEILNIASWPVDGIIAFDSPVCAQALQETSGQLSIVGMGTAVSDGMDAVWVDVYNGTREAIRHLLATGARRVACLGHLAREKPGDQRLAAYAEVMQEAGLATEYIPVRAPELTQYRSLARTVIKDYIRSHGCPEGIFACTDEVAIGGLRGLRDLGIRVPGEVALVGFDGIDETAYHDPPISTVEMPIEEVCRKAWELLQQRMENKTAYPKKIVLESRLVIRESSGRGSGHDMESGKIF